MKIGIRIKNLRSSQRVTLKDLAKKTGLTTSFLSQLERDLTSPSVKSLEKIAEALNTKVSYFFFDKAEKHGYLFVKRGMGKKIVDKEKNIACETLASGLLNIKMEPIIFTLGIGAELSKELMCPEGERFGIVLNGRLEFTFDEEGQVFEEGDSIYCTYPRIPQRVKNVGEIEAKVLWVMFIQSYA